jgi:hypothetical protein
MLSAARRIWLLLIVGCEEFRHTASRPGPGITDEDGAIKVIIRCRSRKCGWFDDGRELVWGRMASTSARISSMIKDVIMREIHSQRAGGEAR